jgi:hypothetical protein
MNGKDLLLVLLFAVVYLYFKNRQMEAQQTPADVLQAIADENAAFWLSVGAPFSDSVTQEGGLSANPVTNTSDVSIGGGFAT